MEKPKLVPFKPRDLEEEIYVNPEVPDTFKWAGEWIEAAGASEVIIVVRCGENFYSEWFATSERSDPMLGTLKKITDEYSQELRDYEAEE